MYLARKQSGPTLKLPDHPVSALVDAIDRSLDWCELQLRKRAVWLAATFTVMVLQAALVLEHRAWLDEWQALQLSLQSPGLAALLDNLRYEGHPPLWYLLLRGASAILPVGLALIAVQLPIALALDGLILFKMPLSRIERLLFALNFYVIVDYLTVSRSLGLGVLLFLAAMLFRERRSAWFVLALLPMVDFLFGALSLVCLAVYRRERRIWVPGLMLWLASAVAAAWAVRPPADLVPASLPWIWWKDLGIQLSRFGSVLLPLQIHDTHLEWNADLPFVAGAPAGLAFLVIGWKLSVDRFSATVFVAFCALVLIFSIWLYPLSTRHVSLAGVLLVALVGLGRERQQQCHAGLFRTWLAAGALLGLVAAALMSVTPFDRSAEAAAYIRAHGLADKHWAVYPNFESQGVSALTGMEFERVDLNCMQSFVRWNHADKIKTWPQLEQKLDRIGARGGFYLMTVHQIRTNGFRDPGAYRLLAHIPAGYDGKDYFLYRIRPDVPVQTAHVPECPPKRLPLRISA